MGYVHREEICYLSKHPSHGTARAVRCRQTSQLPADSRDRGVGSNLQPGCLCWRIRILQRGRVTACSAFWCYNVATCPFFLLHKQNSRSEGSCCFVGKHPRRSNLHFWKLQHVANTFLPSAVQLFVYFCSVPPTVHKNAAEIKFRASWFNTDSFLFPWVVQYQDWM